MSRWLLALLLAAAGWPTAGAHDALDAIDGCLRELDPGLDVGYQRIAARCPDLTPTLVQSQYAAWLPRDWNQTGNLLSADGLTELRALLTREPAATAARRAPSVEHLAAVLAKVTQSDQPRAGWWTRLKQWLREVHGCPGSRIASACGSWPRPASGCASGTSRRARAHSRRRSRADGSSSRRCRRRRGSGRKRAPRMRERLITLACAVGALLLAAALFVRHPAAGSRSVALPTTIEHRGNGLLGAWTWLAAEGVRTVSLRERFDAVAKRRDLARDGNLLIVTLPVATPWQAQESRALD